MASLRTALQDLARSFADQVMDAIRGANIEELLDAGGARGAARGRTTAANPKPRGAKAPRPGRMQRRSAEEIKAALDGIVGLLKKRSDASAGSGH